MLVLKISTWIFEKRPRLIPDSIRARCALSRKSVTK
jgi:hypothetical protein